MAVLDGPERDLRLLSDHRDDLLAERRRIQLRLRWHLHDLELDLRLPPRALDRYVWLERTEAALRGLPPTTCTPHRARAVQRAAVSSRRACEPWSARSGC